MKLNLRILLSILIYFSIYITSNAQNNIKKYVLEPTPTWVKKYPIPELQESYSQKLPMLQLESQYNHETGENYTRVFYYLKDLTAINKIRSYYTDYEPDYETVSIHKVTIHREAQKISYGDQLHVEYAQEGKQINGKHYDVDGKVIIFFDNKLKIGDIIELAYTSKGFQPDLHNSLFYDQTLTRSKLKGKIYARVLSKKNKPIQYTLLNANKKPNIKTRNGIMSIEYIHDSKDNPEDNNAPIWHQLDPKIYITDLNSWSDFLKLNQLNFQLDRKPTSEVVQKVNEIVNKNDEKTAQINAILQYIQKDIEYLEYDKIKPKQPEIVLKQGFGDCKSMSLLAIKMLETINVEAWPVIVNSDGYDNRLLDVVNHAFDHCVLEFVHKRDTILFDATNDPQLGTIYQKYTSDFRYGFRIKKGTSQVTKINHKERNEIDFESIVQLRKEEENNYYKSVIEKITYKGEIANNHIDTYKQLGAKHLASNLRYNILTSSWIPDSIVNFSHSENEPKAILKLSEYNPGTIIFNSDFETNTKYLKPKGIQSILSISKENPSAPIFELPKINKTTLTYKFLLPGTEKVAEDSSVYKKDWVNFSKKVIHQKDTLIAAYTLELLKKELDSKRFDEIHKDIDSIKKLSIIEVDFTLGENIHRNSLFFFDYVIPIIFLVIVILTILLIIKFIKRGKKIKKQKIEINSLNDELKKYKTD